jgi:hypothetical protein
MVEKKKGEGKITAITTKQANATVALPFMRAMARQGTEIGISTNTGVLYVSLRAYRPSARVSPTIAAGFGWLALVAALVSGLGSAANSVIAEKIPLNAAQATVLLWQ